MLLPMDIFMLYWLLQAGFSASKEQKNGARKITIYSSSPTAASPSDICKNETYFPGPFISAADHKLR